MSVTRAYEPAARPEVRLPALDNAALLMEDRVDPPPAGLRFSRGQAVTPPIGPEGGLWQELPLPTGGGWIWTIDLVTPGATGTRVHFSGVNLPEGASLVVYPPDDPKGFAGPYLERGPLEDGEFWATSTPGERARIELFMPKHLTPTGLEPPRIDSIQHEYLDPTAPNLGLRGPGCENDVTCSSAFANVSHSIARISFVENGNGFLCSGGLINPQNGDLTPYFLTSNTCIATNTVAQTTQFFWLYQTTSCNGTAPTLSSVPKSSVATLAATLTSTDATILMEEGTLPCGLFWSGVDFNAIPNGQASASIHHPQGGVKKISFGTKATATSTVCSTGDPNFVRVNWTDGAAESGSEGAPIFRNDTMRVYGQNSCGQSSCASLGFTNFGAISATFSGSTTVQTLLAGGSDDALEPNDTCATAITITEGTFTGRVVKFQHDDWFRVNIPAAATFSITLTFTDANGDIDMELFSTCGGTAVASSAGTTNVESIVFTNSGAGANFLLHVFLSDCDTRNGYTMVVSGSLVNDTCSTATVIPATATTFTPGPYSTLLADASASEPQESCEVGSAGVSNTVWYTFTPCGNGAVTVDTFGSSYNTVLSMFTGTCTAATQVACSDDAIGTQARLLSVPVTAGTTYLIKVADYNTTAGGGTLDFNFAYAPTPPAHDQCSAAVVIPGNATAFNPTPFCTVGATVTAGDPAESCGFTSNSNPVYYSFTPCGDGRISVDSNGSSYDTVLSIFTGTCVSPVELACDDDSGAGLNSQLINVPVTVGTAYLIKVADFGNPDGGTLDFNFSYSPTEVPPNDSCSSPTVILGNSFSPPVFCTVGANASIAEPQESCEVGGVGVSNSVWYTFTPGCTGVASVDTNGSDYDTVLSIFTGTCSSAVQLACDDDSGTGANSQLTNVPMTAGTTYMIKVADYGGPNGGSLAFHFLFNSAGTPTDSCLSNAPITDGARTFATCGATTDTDPPLCGISNDIWFRYTSPCTGTVTVSTCTPTPTFAPAIAIYHVNGTGCPSPSMLVACSFGGTCGLGTSVSFPAVGGQQYKVQIGSVFGATGSGTLTIGGCPICRADFNLSGAVTVQDIFDFLAAYFSNNPGADFNNSGAVTVQDIFDFLAAYFTGC